MGGFGDPVPCGACNPCNGNSARGGSDLVGKAKTKTYATISKNTAKASARYKFISFSRVLSLPGNLNEKGKMKTSIWGPSAWRFLHAVSFAYPHQPNEAEKKAAYDLLASLQYLLPCGDCCAHYCSEFSREKIRPHLESRATFSKWLVDLHNRVNARLGKGFVDYQVAAKEYEGHEEFCELAASCGEEPKKNNSLVLKILLLALFFLVVAIKVRWA